MRKLLALLLIVMMLLASNMAFAEDDDIFRPQSSNFEIVKNSSNNKLDENLTRFITTEQLVELLNKYDMSILSNEEVSNLGLKVNPNNKKYDLNLTYDEMDELIQELKKEAEQPLTEKIVFTSIANEPNLLQYSTATVTPLATQTYGTGTRTIESSETFATGLTDLTIRCAVAINYSYNWENYPGEPYREFNYNVTSHSQGSVTQTDSGSYNRLRDANSSASKISSTVVRQQYSGIVDQYIPVGYIWIKIGEKSLSGTVNHYIP
ncbi:MAG TPA: hypothetical protein DCS67_12550 [Clostridiales bacterium UBA8960]|jgi:hypothetical protein|nr:hypothetical protein [Clostridiales bacterium UBA8960]